SFFQKMTSRFVAGETIEDAAKVVHELNNRNISASFDHLGESIKNEAEAGAEVLEYSRILERISAEKLRSGVSIKPTQLGLDINLDLCLRNIRNIVEKARDHDCFVRIDMEDSAHTDTTLDLFKKLRKDFDNVGIVIQSYLYRSRDDVIGLLK